jgi:hypothetical protein
MDSPSPLTANGTTGRTPDLCEIFVAEAPTFVRRSSLWPYAELSLAEESVSATQSQKPVVVFDGRKWRRYHWDRQLLEQTLLGDFIPKLNNHSANEPAAAHIYGSSDAPADIVSSEPPSFEVWGELRRIWGRIENEHAPSLDEICCAAIQWQSRE